MNLAAFAPAWLTAILIFLLLIAAAEDAWRLRISNWTSLAILLSALVAMALIGPTWALWKNGAIFIGLLVIGTPLFAAGKLGGGDVKLLAVSSLWFDFGGAVRMILAVAIAGGLLALILLALRRLKWSEKVLANAPVLRRRGGIPYGVAIAAGALITIALQSAAPTTEDRIRSLDVNTFSSD